MASLLDSIPGYWDAVARESTGRDAAYLRLPRLVAGIALRPLTLLDYLRLSAEGSPFIAGGLPGKDDCAFLLWHQRIVAADVADESLGPKAFASMLDPLDVAFLVASCGQFVDEALTDAPGGSIGKHVSYYGIGAMLVSAFRKAYPGVTKAEILNTPMDELFQEFRAMQPRAVMFNRSDRLKAEWLAERRKGASGTKSGPRRRRAR